MFGSSLTVGSFVEIRDGCPLRFEIGGSGMVFVECGTPDESFNFNMESEALRKFLRLGTKALREMDAQYDREQDKPPAG